MHDPDCDDYVVSGYVMHAGKGDSYLVSPIKTHSIAGCLLFSYHGRGSNPGTLGYSIVTVPDGVTHASDVVIGAVTYTTLQLPLLDVWETKAIDLPTGRHVVVFRSQSGSDALLAYISIDDMILHQGTCQSQTPCKYINQSDSL